MGYPHGVNRDRIAAALLAIAALALLWYGFTRAASGCACGMGWALPLVGLGTLQGLLGVSVASGRPTARWLAMGVSFFWVLTALLLAADAPVAWLLVALHAPLPLLLARPDELHARTSLSLLLAGAALPMVLVLGLPELAMSYGPAWARIGAMAVAIVGVVGLARQRTWGVLLIALAGLAFLGTEFAGAYRATDEGNITALVLLGAALPFGGPVLRFLRS